jgi:pyruvate dehydrogenase E2 component (dihydrolipoamide acetyltransferase)
MADKLLMIALSPTMEKGTIHTWHVKEGDAFSTGDILCDVETDKTTMEYESPEDAILLKILVNEGGQASVGDPIAIFGEEGEDISPLLDEIKKEKSSKPDTNREEKEKEPASEKKTDPDIEEESPESQKTTQPEATTRIKASPLARKIAEERGLNLSQIRGSGPQNRIVKRDVENYKPQEKSAITHAPSSENSDQRIPLSEKRQIIAKRLSESKYSAPHFYLRVQVDMTRLLEARKRYHETHPDAKTSLNAWLIKLSSEALKKHPEVNSGWDTDALIRFGNVHIGLAVAQEDGLITPVVKSVEYKKIAQVDHELQGLIEKAKNNKLSPEEYTGATFTISNLGAWGIEEFTAIINPPGSAILALGAIEQKPVVINNEIIIRPMMSMTLSCDHRVIDGATGADFMKTLKAYIDDPALALT